MVEIENLTIKQVKELKSVFSGATPRRGSIIDQIGKRVLIRTRSAGVHIGTLAEVEGDVAKLTNTRRLWSWSGAFTLSTVAQDGVKSAKMPSAIPSIILRGWIEIIPLSENANAQLSELKSHE